MGAIDSNTFRHVLDTIKEYSFFITLVTSAAITIGYMVVFRVNPWDKQRSEKLRRERVRFHDSIARTLLEGGHFKSAKSEFEEALKLEPVDHSALNGLYLSELYLALNSPEWDPAVGLAIQQHLSRSGSFEQEHVRHIVEKYLGDLNYRINNRTLAVDYYQKALARSPNYPDALYTLGWFYYSEQSDADGMETLFRRMAKSNPHDYRGFHGLGYALYMKAIAEQDPKRRAELIADAARQSGSAQDLCITQLHIVMDFGEVARSGNPSLSISYHEWGKKILDDPLLRDAGDNGSGFLAKLLVTDGRVDLANKEQKLVWVEYQLALDYLALHRSTADDGAKTQHEQRLTRALSMDSDKQVHGIYLDQIAILDRLLPG